MLSGLFKRKDRKSKTQTEDDDPEWLQKQIAASRQSPQPKASSESTERQVAPLSPSKSQPSRQSSKLQKAPPPSRGNSKQKGSPKQEPPSPKEQQQHLSVTPVTNAPSAAPQLDQPILSSPLSNPFEDGAAFDESGANGPARSASAQQQSIKSREQTPEPHDPAATADRAQADARSRNVFAPIKDALRSGPGGGAAPHEAKPEKVKKARERMALDDSEDSEADESGDASVEAAPGPYDAPPQRSAPAPPVQLQKQPQQAQQAPRLQTQPLPDRRTGLSPSDSRERLSESPVQVSPIVPAQKAELVGASEEPRPVSPPSPASTPELLEPPGAGADPAHHAPRHGPPPPPHPSAQPHRHYDPYAQLGAESDSDSDVDSSDFEPAHHHPSDFEPAHHHRHPTTYPAPAAQHAPPARQHAPSTTTTATTASSAPTAGLRGPSPAWSDAGLRAFLDNGGGAHSPPGGGRNGGGVGVADAVRDLLLVVHDTSGVKAPGADHPVVRSFGRETERVEGLESRLDDMLMGLLEKRRGKAGVTVGGTQ